MSDQWPAWLGKKTKKAVAMLEAARRELNESDTYVCPLGCCEQAVHPTRGLVSGVGPADCPHADDDAEAIRATWHVR